MKRHFFICFINTYYGCKPSIQNDAIDTSPLQWLAKWHSGTSGSGLTYEQVLVSWQEITKDEYDYFKTHCDPFNDEYEKNNPEKNIK